MKPNRAARLSDGSDKGVAVGRDRDPLLLGRVEGDLFRRAVGKRWRQRCARPSTTAPKYIHRPSGDHAAERQGPFGPHGAARGAAVKRHDPAGLSESSAGTHLDDEDRFAVRRRIGVMRHGALVLRKVDLARVCADFRRGHDAHVHGHT